MMFLIFKRVLIVKIDNHFEVQGKLIDRKTLLNRFSKRPLSGWEEIGRIKFNPKDGSDITKVIFSEFRWVKNEK